MRFTVIWAESVIEQLAGLWRDRWKCAGDGEGGLRPEFPRAPDRFKTGQRADRESTGETAQSPRRYQRSDRYDLITPLANRFEQEDSSVQLPPTRWPVLGADAWPVLARRMTRTGRPLADGIRDLERRG
jgi:hypothetical protein